LWRWANRLPKIDLHRHLEGSLRLVTLTELARAYAIPLPSYDVEGLRPHVQMVEDAPDFRRFIDKFELLRKFYTSREAIQRITREAIIDAALDNIVYLELRFNPLALARVQGFAFADVVAWVLEATAEAEQETGMRTCLILQIPRQEPLAVADKIVDIAIANFGRWVRGVDLAGDEVTYPPELFIEPFQRAYDAGLHITVHAGEAMGADSVRRAILYLHPQRIGHGIRSIEDSSVIRMLYDQGLALEVCPTSNLHTGVVPTLAAHPLADLLRLRLRVTLNTDDPGVSATTLTDEVLVAVERIGVAPGAMYRMLRHSAEAAFIPDEERAGLCARLAQALAHDPDGLAAFTATAAAN
jgi:adenosine deaminase